MASSSSCCCSEPAGLDKTALILSMLACDLVLLAESADVVRRQDLAAFCFSYT